MRVKSTFSSDLQVLSFGILKVLPVDILKIFWCSWHSWKYFDAVSSCLMQLTFLKVLWCCAFLKVLWCSWHIESTLLWLASWKCFDAVAFLKVLWCSWHSWRYFVLSVGTLSFKYSFNFSKCLFFFRKIVKAYGTDVDLENPKKEEYHSPPVLNRSEEGSQLGSTPGWSHSRIKEDQIEGNSMKIFALLF